MRPLSVLLVAVSVACLSAPLASAGTVTLAIRDGRVTLVARDATVRQILLEWASVGQTTIVNLDRVPGGPVNLELRDVPEGRALDSVLRSLAGYIAAPKPAGGTGASGFARIVVMPVLATVASAKAPAAGGRSAAPRGDVGRMPWNARQPDPAAEGEGEEEAFDEVIEEDPEALIDEEEEEAPPDPEAPVRPPVGLRQPGMMPPPETAAEDLPVNTDPAAAQQPLARPYAMPGTSAPGFVPAQPQTGSPGAQPKVAPGTKPPGGGH
jgi:hypothetical protein